VSSQALKRAILGAVVRHVRAQNLDWIDDLPTAPTTAVPPKPPPNPH
jgi:hypothetical protein